MLQRRVTRLQAHRMTQVKPLLFDVASARVQRRQSAMGLELDAPCSIVGVRQHVVVRIDRTLPHSAVGLRSALKVLLCKEL